MVVGMMDNLRKFCEENNIDCRVYRDIDEPVRVRMYHRPSDRGFTDICPFLSDMYIELIIDKAKHVFDMVDVASLYPKFYMDTDIAAKVGKLSKRLVAAEMRAKRPEITKVIFNDPAVIVLWSDGDKTVVKADNEPFDPEKGLAMAIAKKFLGTNKNKSNYYDEFKEWLPEDEAKTLREEIASPLDKLSRSLKNLTIPKLPIAKINSVEEKDGGIEVKATPITYLTPAQLADKLGYTADTIRKQCAAGMHPGAKKVNGRWMIPWAE